MRPSTNRSPANRVRPAARRGRRPAGGRGARPATRGARRRPASSSTRRTSGRRPSGRRRPTSRIPGVPTRIAGLFIALGVGVVATLVLTIGIAAAARNISQSTAAAPAGPGCPDVAPVLIGEVVVPAGPVAGYCQDRLVNAAHVIDAAKAMGLGPRAQTIGVMTAMGESSLVNVDHGDRVGPDSRGLFQQRGGGSWGTYAERMTPQIAATHFFERLVGVPGWSTRPPTLVAHAVQINADPDHYAKYWPAAETVVAALTTK